MKDREFNRLKIENADGQIHAKNDKAHPVEELPLRAVSEKEEVAESYRTDETGMTGTEPGKETTALGTVEKSSIQTETRKSTIQIVATTTVSAPIVAALAVVVSAVLVVTSVVGSLSVKVALQAKTAFSLLFSLAIQNPDEVPLFAVLSADGQDEIIRPLQTEDTELAFESLQPETKYTLKILKIVQSDDGKETKETLFEKYYYTDRGKAREPVVIYTVTEEEWNAAFAPESFGNATIRLASYSEESGRTSDQTYETVIVYANGYMLQLSDDWVELRQTEDGESSLEFLHEAGDLLFADFTFDEASNLYRFVRSENDEGQGTDQTEQSSVIKYAVGFQNGVLTSFEQIYESTYGEEVWRSVQQYTFEQYGTSFINTQEMNGINYVSSSASDSWIAYEWIDRESTGITIPAELSGLAVTGVSGYIFTGSETLTTVSLPGTLSYLGDNFSNCSALSSIYYDGTQEQWETLAKNISLPDSVTVYCSDGTIPTDQTEVNPIEPNQNEGN